MCTEIIYEKVFAFPVEFRHLIGMFTFKESMFLKYTILFREQVFLHTNQVFDMIHWEVEFVICVARYSNEILH